MRAYARLTTTRSRWSLNFVNKFSIYWVSDTERGPDNSQLRQLSQEERGSEDERRGLGTRSWELGTGGELGAGNGDGVGNG
jgi:hypothetical protein